MVSLLLVLLAPAYAASVEVQPGDDVVALTASLSPGSEIIFHGGTYDIEDNLDWTGAGTEDAPIVLRAADGETPVLELTDGWTVAHLHDASHVEIRGLTFQGSNDLLASGNGFTGLEIEDSSDVTVEGCVFQDTWYSAFYLSGNDTGIHVLNNEMALTSSGFGIYVGCGDGSCWTADSEIRGNWIHDIQDDWAHGMWFGPGTTGVTIADNVVERVTGRGIYVGSTQYGDPNTVEGNAVWSVQDQGLYLEGAAVVRNNVVFLVDGEGIRSDEGDYVLEKQVISFNTVAETSDWGVRVYDWAGKSGMVFADNVVANPTGLAFHADDDALDGGDYLSTNYLTGYVEGIDPAVFPNAFQPGGGYNDFADVTAPDFYPTPTSTLVDVGDPASDAYVPDVDFNGSLRDGQYPDVGAYELVAESNPGWQITDGFKELVSDPNGETGRVGGCCGNGGKDKETDAVVLFPLALFGAWRRRRSRK